MNKFSPLQISVASFEENRRGRENGGFCFLANNSYQLLDQLFLRPSPIRLSLLFYLTNSIRKNKKKKKIDLACTQYCLKTLCSVTILFIQMIENKFLKKFSKKSQSNMGISSHLLFTFKSPKQTMN